MILLPAFVIFAVLLLIAVGRVGFWLGREGPIWRVAALMALAVLPVAAWWPRGPRGMNDPIPPDTTIQFVFLAMPAAAGALLGGLGGLQRRRPAASPMFGPDE